MRGWLAVAGALTVVLTTCVLSSAPAAACSLAAPSFTLIGPALAKHDGVVTYRVESIAADFGATGGPVPVDAPPVGSTVDVEYLYGDTQFVDIDSRYHVTVWRDPTSGEAGSSIHGANGSACGANGTVHADGSTIDTAIRIFGVRAWIAYPVIAVLALVAAWISVLVSVRWVAKRRRARRRRLRALA